MSNPTPQGGEPVWSNKQLSLQAECIVAGKYGVIAVYDVLKGVRDAVAKEVKRRAATELETAQATIAAQAAQIAALRQELAGRGAWETLPDGEYKMPLWNGGTYTLHVTSDGADLEAWDNAAENKLKDGTPIRIEEIGIGEYRLCRLTPASRQAAVGVAAQEEANDATE